MKPIEKALSRIHKTLGGDPKREDAEFEGYRKVGIRDKKGRKVPNSIPEEEMVR